MCITVQSIGDLVLENCEEWPLWLIFEKLKVYRAPIRVNVVVRRRKTLQ